MRVAVVGNGSMKTVLSREEDGSADGCVTHVIGKESVLGIGKTVGPEQDRTERSRSWMGASKSNSFTIVTKMLLRMQSIAFDDAVDGRIDINCLGCE